LRTGILDKYPVDLRETIGFLSGGQHRPGRSDKLEALQKRLTHKGYTGFEFCYFLMYGASERPRNIERRLSILQRTNWFVKHDIWKEFTKYKQKRAQVVKDLVGTQMETLTLSLRLDPLRDVETYLLDMDAPLNVIVRIEYGIMAEQHGQIASLDFLLEKFSLELLILVLGCPEYLDVCPLLKKELENRDSNVARALSKY
jgi:hypothetical protein